MMLSPASGHDQLPPIIDPGRSSPARVDNALLGGGHNFAADRRAAARLLAADPRAAIRLWIRRRLLRRVTRLALDAGIRQVVHLGCGIPFPGGIHTAVSDPRAVDRIVYVDDDPVVVELIDQATNDSMVTAIDGDPDNLPEVLNQLHARQVISTGEPVLVILASRTPARAATRFPQAGWSSSITEDSQEQR
ncbi:MAG: SAM-dependent methyltransferase [Micromonosporaceae bacterium]|nr:SAM-dependent methyltransferase [Micromonosporaceae bacterium]